MLGGAFNYGNVPIKIKGDGDYNSKLAEAKGMAANAYVMGVQETLENGVGAVVGANRHPLYANSNIPGQEAYFGEKGNFRQQTDSVGNQLTTDFNNQTGFGPESGASSTHDTQNDPRTVGQNAALRMAMMQNGQQYPGLNNRQQMYRA